MKFDFEIISIQLLFNDFSWNNLLKNPQYPNSTKKNFSFSEMKLVNVTNVIHSIAEKWKSRKNRKHFSSTNEFSYNLLEREKLFDNESNDLEEKDFFCRLSQILFFLYSTLKLHKKLSPKINIVYVHKKKDYKTRKKRCYWKVI